LSLYVGMNATAEELGLQGTNLWIYPSFDHEQNMRRFAENVDAPFPAVYISFPSAKDPDFARRQPGKSTIELIVPIAYNAFAQWSGTRWKQRGAMYEALKQKFTTRLLEELHRQVPQVAGHVEHAELSTPVTTQHFTNYEQGEIYGIAATPARHALRALGARTPLKNLFLTGQDATTLGIVGAMYGGVICASAALRRNLMSAAHKPLPA
jgi:all-trans-retinol 13,14-reductase